MKSLMAEWLEQVSQWHEMDCHGLEVMSSNPGWVELTVHSTFVLFFLKTKNKVISLANILYAYTLYLL